MINELFSAITHKALTQSCESRLVLKAVDNKCPIYVLIFKIEEILSTPKERKKKALYVHEKSTMTSLSQQT